MKMFFNKYSIIMCLATLLQQLIVCSSTLWITFLSKSIINGGTVFLWLGFFIASLTLVYIPSSIAAIARNKAIFFINAKYNNTFIDGFYSKARYRKAKAVENSHKPYLISEAENIIQNTIYFYHDIFSCFLNVILNIGILGLAISYKLTLAYCVSIPLVFIVLLLSNKVLIGVSQKSQEDHVELSSVLLPSWDNILIGNKYNLSIWKSKYNSAFKNAQVSGQKEVILLEFFSSISMILAIIPIIAILVLFMYENINNPSLIVALIATLPRQIQIIQYFSDIVYHLINMKSINVRIEELKKALCISQDEESDFGKINFSKIKICYDNRFENIRDTEDLRLITQDWRSGRFTIRGANGSGKSTLLYLWKEMLSEKAFLFPTNSELCFNSTNNLSLSSGQKMIAELEEVITQANPSIVFLDEWDANLDIENKERINSKIEKISKEICVVEVKHGN